MKHSGGGWIIIRSVLCMLLSTTLYLSYFFVAEAVSPGDLVILRLQITGGTGQTDKDFITIYNKSSSIIDLNGLRLVKRTKTLTTDTTIKSWVSSYFLDPGSIFMWANSNYSLLLGAHTQSTHTLSNDNSIAIRNGTENTGEIIDAVGWGSIQNSLWEGSPYPTNPGANEILQRISNQDSNNNALDFHVSHGSYWNICGNNFIESPETCDDGNIYPGDGCDNECHLEIIVPVCGNNLLEASEECDDGNNTNDDGCSALCQIELPPIITPPITICGNNIIEETEQCDDGNTANNDGCSTLCQTEVIINYGDIRINEFVADPLTGQDEWIELFTNLTSDINITDWTIEDGAGSKTKLTGTIGGNQKFVVIEKPTGSLNNTGDIIVLKNKNGVIINQISYGSWDDGDTRDNAPMTSDPFSVALISENTISENDSLDYAVTSTVTKGQNNIITPLPVETAAEETEDNYDYSQEILITEIFPNPVGIDDQATQKEFIELYNSGERTVRLDGWRLEIDDKQYVYEFPLGTFIEGKQYITLIGIEKFKLNNDGTSIKLFQPLKQTSYQTITYKETTEGQSWILVDENNMGINKIWQWTSVPTENGNNIQVLPPKATFSFSGKLETGKKIKFDSSDSETGGLTISYNWNFGDNTTSNELYPEHTYTKAGTFTVVLTVNNSFGTSTLAKKIKIFQNQEVEDEKSVVTTMITSDDENDISNTNSKIKYVSDIEINEILPNPSGKDEGEEWLEIINHSDTNIDLKNWRIGNKSKKGSFLEETIIKAGGIYTISGKYLPTLGNTDDTISIYNSSGQIVDTISYSDAPENKSYSRFSSGWGWSEPSRNLPNKPSNLSNKKVSASSVLGVSTNFLTGTVVSMPGTFGTQYFYVQVKDSNILYQVYNSKKLFPKLVIGQKIQVSGELGSTETGPRFKTDTAEDIIIVGQEETSEIINSTSLEINKPPYPRLVKVEGEVTSKKSPRLILTDQTGDIEIYLSKGSELSITAFAIGDKLTVTGILELSGTTPRVMPRSQNDIIHLNAPEGPTSTTNDLSMSADLASHQRDNQKNILIYIILISLAVIGGGSYVIWKYYKKNTP